MLLIRFFLAGSKGRGFNGEFDNELRIIRVFFDTSSGFSWHHRAACTERSRSISIPARPVRRAFIGITTIGLYQFSMLSVYYQHFRYLFPVQPVNRVAVMPRLVIGRIFVNKIKLRRAVGCIFLIRLLFFFQLGL